MNTPETLPAFRYHPDPVDTGSVTVSDAKCVVCNERRGFIYAGPVYAEDGDGHRTCEKECAYSRQQPEKQQYTADQF